MLPTTTLPRERLRDAPNYYPQYGIRQIHLGDRRALRHLGRDLRPVNELG